MSEQEQLETLRSNLNHIKTMQGDKAEDEFFNLMEKCKKAFGEQHLYIAQFYLEYAKFIIDKLEKNVDVFNTQKLPEAGPEILQAQNQEYDEDSSVEQPKSENNINNNNNGVNGDFPVITEDKEDKQDKQQGANPELSNQNRDGQKSENKEQKKQEEDDDFEICAANLIAAIKIFETEKNRLIEDGQNKLYTIQQVKKMISRSKSRLGDLYHLNENYMSAVEVYQQVIANQEQNQGHQSNRGLAEIHYMVANSYLYQNKPGCEIIAIKEFILSAHILLNCLRKVSNENDDTFYEIPTTQTIKVDRFSYLPKATDFSQQKQLKQVLNCLLDKIEDASEQIGIREQYQKQREKKKDQEPNTFNEVTQNTPAVNLGTFGNRKKKPTKQKQQ